MKLSIIVPVYNARDYLRACTDSILAHSSQELELILVDDGSTDGSGALCDAIAGADARVRAIHQANRGPGGARNTGLEAAVGEYVWFVDSDDGVMPGALERIRAELDRYRPDILSFDYRAVAPGGAETDTRANLGPAGVGFRLGQHPAFLNSMPATWARVWRRGLFLENGIRFPERVFYGEDLQTSGKLFALAREIRIVPEPLYRYYDRPGSLMNAADPERNRHMIQAMGDLTDWYEARGLRAELEEQLCAMAIEHLLMAATVRVAKGDPRSPVLGEIRRFMEERYPDWRQNPSVAGMSRAKKLALGLIQGRHYRILGWLFRMKGRM